MPANGDMSVLGFLCCGGVVAFLFVVIGIPQTAICIWLSIKEAMESRGKK